MIGEFMRNRILLSAILALVALLLTSCYGSSSGLNLFITDAPIDQASSIIVGIDYVTVSGDQVKPVTVTFASPLNTNVYQFQGGTSSPVFTSLPVASGHYTKLRIGFAADPISLGSSITLPDGVHVLYIPSTSPPFVDLDIPDGAKPDGGFTIGGGQTINLTVDFDMRKSIVQDPNDSTRFLFIPQLRVVQNQDVGTLTGSVDASLLRGLCTPAVYVYSGQVTPTDENFKAPAGEVQPVSSGLVGLNSTTGAYNFTVGFLPPGNYTVAFTCNADQDVSNKDNGPTGNNTVFFNSVASATVIAQQVVQVALK
jgi:hypothetical protein